MKDYIFIDGQRIIDTIPLRTLFYGEGVFETFRYRNSLPVLIDTHLSRMERGASLLQIPFPAREYIAGLVNKAVLESGLGDRCVKICLLSNGTSTFYETASSSQVLIIIKEYSLPSPSVRLKPNSFKIISESPLRAVKSMNYLGNVVARREALGLGFDEALFVNEKEEVVECSASNIFWFKDKTLFTPSVDSGCLPGATRDLILSLVGSLDMQIKKGRYLLKDLVAAEFVFITNSLLGCVPVSEVDGSLFNADHESFHMIKDALLKELKWL